MKKKLILLLISIFFLLSCASKKKIVKTEKTISKQTETFKKDSSVALVKSLPIKDTLFFSLHTNNTVVDSVIKSRLRSFYTSKSSGKNKLIATYDTIKKGLKFITSVSASDSIYIKVKEKTAKEDLFIKKRDESRVVNRHFNWWFYLFLFALVVSCVYYLYKKIF